MPLGDRSELLYSTLANSNERTFEKMCISLISSNQLKPFNLLRQCIHADAERMRKFILPPNGIAEFVQSKHSSIVVLRSYDTELSVTRIQDTIDNTIPILNDKELKNQFSNFNLVVYRCDVLTSEIIESCMKLACKVICICSSVKSVPEEISVLDETVSWDDLTTCFKNDVVFYFRTLPGSDKELIEKISSIRNEALVQLISECVVKFIGFDKNNAIGKELSNTIFNYHLGDKLCFHRIKRETLSVHVKLGNRLGGISDNLEELDYIILEDEQQYHKIKNLIESNVHLIDTQEGRFRLLQSKGADEEVKHFIKCTDLQKCDELPMCKCGNHFIGSKNLIWSLFHFPKKNLTCSINIMDILLRTQTLNPSYRSGISELMNSFSYMCKSYDGVRLWEEFHKTFPGVKLVFGTYNAMEDAKSILKCTEKETQMLTKVAANMLFPTVVKVVITSGFEKYVQAGVLNWINQSLVFAKEYEPLAWEFIAHMVTSNTTKDLPDVINIRKCIFENCFEHWEDQLSTSWLKNSSICSNKIKCFKFTKSKLFKCIENLVSVQPSRPKPQEIITVKFASKWIHACVFENHFNLLKNMVELGVHQSLFESENLVILAIKYGNIQTVEFVVTQFVLQANRLLKDITIELSNKKLGEKYNVTILHVAALRGNYKIIEFLLKKHGFIDLVDPVFMLLSFCVTDTNMLDLNHVNERQLIIDSLMELRPSLIQELNRMQRSCLLTPNINVDLIIHLISLGVDLCICDDNSSNFLHLCPTYLSPLEYQTVTKYLIDTGNTNIFQVENKERNTPLHTAVQHLELLDSTLEALLAANVDFNGLNGDDHSVLTMAVMHGRGLQILEVLIRTSSNLHKKDKGNQTLLHIAAKEGNLTALRALISSGCECDVNEQDEHCETPLHLALKYSNKRIYEIVKVLVNNGAIVNTVNRYQCTAIACAMERHKAGEIENNIIEFLKQVQNRNTNTKHLQDDASSTFMSRKKIIVEWDEKFANELINASSNTINTFRDYEAPSWTKCRVVKFKLGHTIKIEERKRVYLSKNIFNHFIPDQLAIINISEFQLKKIAKFGQKIGKFGAADGILDYVILSQKSQFAELSKCATRNIHFIWHEYGNFQLLETHGVNNNITKFFKKIQICDRFPLCDCSDSSTELSIDISFAYITETQCQTRVMDCSMSINEVLPAFRRLLNLDDAIELFQLKKLKSICKILHEDPYSDNYLFQRSEFLASAYKCSAMGLKKGSIQMRSYAKQITQIVTLLQPRGFTDSEECAFKHIAVNSVLPECTRKVDISKVCNSEGIFKMLVESENLVFQHDALSWYFFAKLIVSRDHQQFVDLRLLNIIRNFLQECTDNEKRILSIPEFMNTEIVPYSTRRIISFVFKKRRCFSFLEFFADNRKYVTVLKERLTELNSEQLLKFAHACLNDGHENLFNLVISLENFNNFFMLEDVVILAVRYSCINIIRTVITKYIRFTNKRIQDIRLELMHEDKESSSIAVSVLHVAAIRGNYTVFEYLLHTQEFLVCLHEPFMRNILCYCVQDTQNKNDQLNDRKLIIDILLQNYPLLIRPTGFGQSPLLVPNINVDLIIHLIRLGADVCAKNKQEGDNFLNLCPYYITVPQDYDKVVQSLNSLQTSESFNLRNDLQSTPLHRAVKYLEPLDTTIDLFVSNGADLNACDHEGDNVLAWAIAYNKSARCLDTLVRAGADVKKRRQTYNRTVLHTAAEFGNFSALRYLIFRGCDVNIIDDRGDTPLHIAINKISPYTDAIVQALVVHGADVNVMDKDMQTPLEIALMRSKRGEIGSSTLKCMQTAVLSSNRSDFF